MVKTELQGSISLIGDNATMPWSLTTGRLQNPSHLSWQLRLASCFMHVVQLFVVSTLKCVLSGTFYHIQNDLKFFPSKTGNKIIIALAGKSSVVEELRNKILTEETQSPNYNLHVSFGFINAKFLDIPLSVTTCH